eukprot:m.227104 g.227104  ORF g.227104 m.227104 type:complete len:304 (+) comp25936_c0_seq1:95-1006(+)
MISCSTRTPTMACTKRRRVGLQSLDFQFGPGATEEHYPNTRAAALRHSKNICSHIVFLCKLDRPGFRVSERGVAGIGVRIRLGAGPGRAVLGVVPERCLVAPHDFDRILVHPLTIRGARGVVPRVKRLDGRIRRVLTDAVVRICSVVRPPHSNKRWICKHLRRRVRVKHLIILTRLACRPSVADHADGCKNQQHAHDCYRDNCDWCSTRSLAGRRCGEQRGRWGSRAVGRAVGRAHGCKCTAAVHTHTRGRVDSTTAEQTRRGRSGGRARSRRCGRVARGGRLVGCTCWNHRWSCGWRVRWYR